MAGGVSSYRAMADNRPKGGYSRPVWQWVLLYIVIGGIIYAIIYYLVIAPRGGYQYNPGAYPTTSGSYQATSSSATTPAVIDG